MASRRHRGERQVTYVPFQVQLPAEASRERPVVRSLQSSGPRPDGPRRSSRWARLAALHRIPSGTWSWKGTATVVLLVLAPQFATLALRPEARNLSDAASVAALVTFPVVLCATVLFYFHWRIVGGTRAAWLVCCLTASAVQASSLAGMRLADPDIVATSPGWLMGVDLVFGVATLGMVLAAHRVRLGPDPVALGAALGLLVTAARTGLVSVPDAAVPPQPLVAAGVVVMLLVQVAIALSILNLGGMPGWVRVRVAWAVALLGITLVAAYPTPFESARNAAAIAAALIGAVLLCTTTAALLRLSIREKERAVEELNDRVVKVEAEVRADRERLHEITGTVAGIASASRLIHDRPDIPAPRKDHLHQMLDSEIGRLARLLQEERQEVTEVDLDTMIWPLVVAQQSLGHAVRWEPSGLHALGRPDDLAEVLHILLENAARHAPGSEAVVETRRVRAGVEITVSDSGPGVSPSNRAEIFAWGVRGPSSSGQGIGLNVALRLMSEQGGYLRVTGVSGLGAVFVIGLPDRGVRNGSVAAAEK